MDAQQLREMSQANEVLTIHLSGATLIQLARFITIAAKRNEETDIEYWVPKFIEEGGVARERSWRYNDDTHDRKSFTDALKRLRIDPVFPKNPGEKLIVAELALKYNMPNVNADTVARAREEVKAFQVAQSLEEK